MDDIEKDVSPQSGPEGNSGFHKRRSATASGILSLLVPGLGQLYNGKVKKSAFFVALMFFIMFVISPYLALSSRGVACYTLLFFALFIWRIVDSVRDSVKQTHFVPRFYNRWYYYVLFTAFVAVLPAVFGLDFKSDYLEALKIPSSAMEDTLSIGDHMNVSKLYYRYKAPAIGDVVIFTLEEDPDTKIIKRIIALPGDTIELKANELKRNGEIVIEPYAKYIFGGKTDFGPARVPEGMVFLLGDNRDLSKDSRFWKDAEGNPAPFIPFSRLQGKALFVYWNSAFDFRHVWKAIE